ncbi:MAG: DUF418 domain-containing protein [Pseudomonadota bacterium]
MTTDIQAPQTAPLAPLADGERIEALDVVRGFALIGVLIMNVEFFNRAGAENGSGMQAGLHGIDLWVASFVAYFVIGKFWTTFSLLFGMGFGVMFTRAQAAGRSFLRPYLRRVAALAVFGALHYVLLWSGDILFSYAAGAIALLVVLYGRARPILLAVAGFGLVAVVPGNQWAGMPIVCLCIASVAAMFMRAEVMVRIKGRSVPLLAVVTLAIGASLALGVGVAWLLPHGSREARIYLPVVAFNVLVLGILMARFHQSAAARARRAGVGLYVFFVFSMCGVGAVTYLAPLPAEPQPIAASVLATKSAAEQKRLKDAVDKAAQSKADKARDLKEHEANVAKETRILSRGSYREALAMRAEHFVKRIPRAAGFASLLMGIFLLGFWFVRSGVMADTRAHLPLFRKLALFGLPLGIGLGLLGSLVAVRATPGLDNDGWMLASSLRMLGNLPASVGYASLVIVMMHSAGVFRHVRVLAPFGRMALTNYLSQSLIASTFFFAHGFGLWGISHAWQMVYVAGVLALQIPLSHWWLARFRYGPLEWVWRAFTYWQLPPMRLAPRWPATGAARA